MVNRKPLSKKNGNNENLRDWKLLEGSLSIGNNKKYCYITYEWLQVKTDVLVS